MNITTFTMENENLLLDVPEEALINPLPISSSDRNIFKNPCIICMFIFTFVVMPFLILGIMIGFFLTIYQYLNKNLYLCICEVDYNSVTHN